MSETQIPSELHDLPVTAKVVYLILRDDANMSTADIAAESGLSTRSVNKGINDLGERVQSVKDPFDSRVFRHTLVEPEAEPEYKKYYAD